MSEERKFDAGKYLTKLKGKDYLEVKWRLLWLRTEHPDAQIETELVAHDRAERWCMFRAKVTIPGGGVATGYGQEDAAGFAGNPGDYPEKAETKALGRALAALGYGTQFTEDFDFADGNENRVVDSPVDRGSTRGGSRGSRGSTGGTNGTAVVHGGQATGATNGASGTNGRTRIAEAAGATVATLAGVAPGGRPESRPVLPATEPQVKAIYAIARGAQAMDDAEVDARCKELYGATPSGLSRRQASEFIDALKAGIASN